MANSDKSGRTGQAAQGGGSNDPSACGAHELKGLLHHIAERIADTDRRHSQALEHMQARLASLGEEARAVRRRVPAEFMPAFDRVEEGLGLLAERIAQSQMPRQRTEMPTAPEAAASQPAPAVVHTAPEPAPVASPAPVVHVPTRSPAEIEADALAAAESAAAAPMPLRSAVAGGRATPTPAPSSEIDPFDVVDRNVADDGGAWDAASAEALSRVYETGDTPFARRMPDPDASSMTAPSPAERARGLELEREWLEGRFADIAHRVEQSLIEMRPDNSLLALGRRFDQLEQRFGSALDGVATRSDVEGLRLVEAQINELAMHFEQAQAQLGRLDAIEGQLQAVVARLSDRRLNDLLERGAAAPTNIDAVVNQAAERAMERFASAMPQPQQPAEAPSFDAVAALAAEQAVARAAATLRQAIPTAAPQPAVDDGRVGEMRQMIEGFIAERRLGEEHTATMLDTMQQAMIRVLDRIDAIELAHHQAQQQAAAPQEYVREQVRFNVGADAQARSAVDDARSAAEAAVAAAQQMPRASAPPAPDLGAGPVRMVGSEPPSSPPPPSGGQGPRGTRVIDEHTKDDFIAAARRARRQVSSQPAPAVDQPASPPPAPPKSTDKAPRAAAPAPQAKGARPVAEKAKDAGSSFFGIPRKTFLGGAVAMLAVMIASLLVPMKLGNRDRAVIGAATPTVTAPAAIEAAQNKAAETAPAVDQSGMPKPAMDFTPRKFDGGRIEEGSAQPKSMSLTAEDSGEDAARQGEAGAYREASAEGPIEEQRPLSGIALQDGGAMPTPEALQRLQNQQYMANISSELGAAAVSSPAALVVEQQLAPQDQPEEPVAKAGKQPVDLPPASVGPLSLRLAAAKGDASAEFEVGARMAEGKGTPQNFAEAAKWYQRAAQRGFAQAQYRLGTLYERGLGLPADLSRARVWYKRAAEQGNVKSMHNLAVLSAGRMTNSPDYATAAQWFTEAAERGLADSQFNLAVLYESGLGVPKDLKQAYKWLAIAARSGDRETVKRREQLRAKLGAGELEAAEAMLRDWSSKPADMMANDARAAGEAWKQSAQNPS